MAIYTKGELTSQKVEISDDFVMTWATPENPYVDDCKADLKIELKSMQMIMLEELKIPWLAILAFVAVILFVLFNAIAAAIICSFVFIWFFFIFKKVHFRPEKHFILTVGCELMNEKRFVLKLNGVEYLELKKFTKAPEAVQMNLYYSKNSKIDFSKCIEQQSFNKEAVVCSDKNKILEQLDNLEKMRANSELDDEAFSLRKREILDNI